MAGKCISAFAVSYICYLSKVDVIPYTCCTTVSTMNESIVMTLNCVFGEKGVLCESDMQLRHVPL